MTIEELEKLAEMVAEKVAIRITKASPSINREWFSPQEVGAILDAKDTTVRNHWIGKGKMKAEKDPYNGHLRVHISEIERYANDHGKSIVLPEMLS